MLFTGTRSLTLAAVALATVLFIVAARSLSASFESGAAAQSGAIAFGFIAVSAVTGLAMAALISSRRKNVLEATLVREDLVIDVLQTAFLAHAGRLPGARVGTAQASASIDERLGGDTFDVRRIDDRYGYILVADVSGKGVPASADTAMIKYTIAAYAHLMRDPAAIVSALNHAFIRGRSVDSSFVVVFFALYDAYASTLHYCAAGPNPAFVRRNGRVFALGVTGPIVGISDDMTFEAATERLLPGDTLLVATDGLTEARDASRAMLTEDGAMRWLREFDDRDPQALATAMRDRLIEFSGGRLEDDLALLCVRIDPDGAAAIRGSGETREPELPSIVRGAPAWEEPGFRSLLENLHARRPTPPAPKNEE